MATMYIHMYKGILLKDLTYARLLSYTSVYFSFAPVMIERNGFQPDNIEYLRDNSIQTCTSFVAGNLQYTQLFKKTYCSADVMTVTLVGRDMKCGQDLSVVGLTAADVNKPFNRWKTCKQIWQATGDDGAEWCSYECDCSGGCKQVMLLRWPKMLSDYSWTLCDISEHCNGKIARY